MAYMQLWPDGQANKNSCIAFKAGVHLKAVFWLGIKVLTQGT